MNESDRVKLAVLDEQIKGLREQHKSHAIEMKLEVKEINKKMDSVLAYKNQQGVVAVLATVMGIVGGLLGKFLKE